ncbi:MAG TPA: hypothetical protein VM925_08775 [Labilithrix sp.]|nr:hypothetical protein [Labilithrix sp.]
MQIRTALLTLCLAPFAATACTADTDIDESPEAVDSVGSPLCAIGRPCIPDPPPPVIGPPPTPSIKAIAQGYSNYDLDGDGIAEINALSLMSFEPETPLGSGASGLAIVFVDPRLVAGFSGSLASMVLGRLVSYRDDLVREGYMTRFFLADVYRGVIHQDGRTLLALRRFLKDVRANHPQLAGVTLVGSFPEATIFRRTLYRSNEAGGSYLDLHPERINPRSEIVLADLDGSWEALYQQNASMEHLKMLVPANLYWPQNQQFLSGTVENFTTVRWEDVFYIQEDFVTRMVAVERRGDPVTVWIESTGQRNPELTSADRARPNPMARPEIVVSRINPKGVAVNPSTPPDLFGRTLLDASGKPQVVEHDDFVPITWAHDPVLEQKILIDYFDRNHAFRGGIDHWLPYRTSAIRQINSGLGAPAGVNDYLRLADPTGFAPSYGVDNATLTHFVDWLKVPGVLRAIEAHSNDHIAAFAEPPSLSALETAIGGRPWSWLRTYDAASGHYILTPTAEGFYGNADWAVGRTLWENRSLLYAGQAFYVHGGCSANVPDGNSFNMSYDDAYYGQKNNAESILFFENGLGEVARGKVFYDRLNGLGASIAAAGGRFGYGWRNAFDKDASEAALKPGTNGDARVHANKRAYFWGLLGDWTLKLRY